jgi:hypothetical protein
MALFRKLQHSTLKTMTMTSLEVFAVALLNNVFRDLETRDSIEKTLKPELFASE